MESRSEMRRKEIMTGFKPSRISPDGIVGRVVAPAEEKFGGHEIRLAIGHGYKDKESGEWKDTSTTFLTYYAGAGYDDEVFTASKGDLVEISGNWSIETRQFGDNNERTAISARYGNFEVIDPYVPKGGTPKGGF